ncbi:hypothetical protein BGZ68_001592 [Mortierella alpina]|nr:hypothetical protein BGZ68_001592 [Mortierella alpina]
MVVDRLLATLGTGPLKRLEVYTFASAANHMNGGGILKHIEHFANEYDFVANIGVLACEPSTTPGSKYDGKVYIDPKATGHLLNMHYLGTTFASGRPATASHMRRYLDGGMHGNFA